MEIIMYKKWIKQLNRNPLFHNMTDEDLLRMLYCIKPEIRNFENKDVITLEGESLQNIGIVLDGEVLVGKENDAGERVILEKIEQSGMFGEIGAFTTKRWPATVIAKGKATILFFPANRINQVCGEACSGHLVMIENMMIIIANKAMKMNRKMEILTMKGIRKKICHYLLQEQKKAGRNTFYIPLKRVELAEYIDVTRPSLSRELGRMQDEGILKFERNYFEILDEEKLKRVE